MTDRIDWMKSVCFMILLMIAGAVGEGFRGLVIGMFIGIFFIIMAYLMSYTEHPKGVPIRGYVSRASIAYSQDSNGNVTMHLTADNIKREHLNRFKGEVELHIVQR